MPDKRKENEVNNESCEGKRELSMEELEQVTGGVHFKKEFASADSGKYNTIYNPQPYYPYQ